VMGKKNSSPMEYSVERAAAAFHDLYVRDEGPGVPVEDSIRAFRKTVYGYFKKWARQFPWRETSDPYAIVVSEIMLQQTQTGRVVEKFVEFMNAFPTMSHLAEAPLADVLKVWQGLGYNRRAKMLHEFARQSVEQFGGLVPDDPAVLVKLPGIGPATASSICAFAFNKPVVFIETNIRTVFIYFFFPGREGVTDRELLPYIEAALDRRHPCRWYSALMDYGVMLKKQCPNPGRRSHHYSRQSRFEGSVRQIRGGILSCLLEMHHATVDELALHLGRDREMVQKTAVALEEEGLVTRVGDRFRAGQ
jgi:A/G-specific adenine glycosylase